MRSAHAELSSAKISLIYSGDEYFVHFLEQIQLAQKSIVIESYIFNLDPIGLKILGALAIARERGVHVRLLVDGVGGYNWIHGLYKECSQRKISLRIYHPPPFGSEFWSHLSWGNLNRWLGFFRRLNKRNHRKLAIFDEKTVLMGSFNISQVHSETYLDEHAWRDTGLLAQNFSDDSDIRVLLSACNEAWRTSRFFRRTNFRSFLRRGRAAQMIHSRFRLNSRTFWRFLLLRDLNRRIKSAKKQILITNAYFIPRKSILRNLRGAARRGVDVCLLLPQVTDAWFVREASRSLYERLLKSGVRIFEYQDRVLHAKTLIIDQWATVGSHNLNHRSLNHDLEVETVLNDPDLILSLKQQWEKDLQHSLEVSLDPFSHRSPWRKIMSRMLYWFRFWI